MGTVFVNKVLSSDELEELVLMLPVEDFRRLLSLEKPMSMLL